MIAADGGKTVGPHLETERRGTGPLSCMISVHFAADLSGVASGHDMLTRFLIDPDIGGSWTSGVMIPEGPTKWGHQSEEWVFRIRNPDQSGVPPNPAAAKAHMLHVPGLRESGIDRVIHFGDWVIQGAVADQYREGRIFLAGDACKVHPPTGGLSMNSGVQDVYNLCWKMEQVLRGVSDPALLDSYEVERRPVAQANVAAALANAQNHFRIDAALGLSDTADAVTNWAAMARLWDNDPAQDGLREAVCKAEQAQRIGFRHHNIEFGYVYRDGALVPDGAAPCQPLDPIRINEPSTRPGHPAPHARIGLARRVHSHSRDPL